MTPLLSYVLIATLLFPGGLTDMPAARQAQAQGTAAATPPRPSATAAPLDGGWPRHYMTGSGARLVLYEPQVASWADQKRIVMYAAVSYTGSDARTTLGTITIEANTNTSVAERLVSFSDFTIA